MSLRTVMFWAHLTYGVTAGAVILVMSVTGVMLAFEPQIVAWAEHDLRYVAPVAPGTVTGVFPWRPRVSTFAAVRTAYQPLRTDNHHVRSSDLPAIAALAAASLRSFTRHREARHASTPSIDS